MLKQSAFFTAQLNQTQLSRLRWLRKPAEANGLEAVDFTVSSTNEIQTVVESMVGKVDAIYAPTDNTIANGMATVAMIANDNGLPVICGESGMVRVRPDLLHTGYRLLPGLDIWQAKWLLICL